MKAMLFAAGKGTRLKPFTDHHPKALASVGGQTLLERNIRYLLRYGISEIVINVHHFAQQLIDFIVANKGFGAQIIISDEQDALLETGGGLKKALPYLQDTNDILVMNADILSNLALDKLIAQHQSRHNLVTLAVMRRDSSRQLLFNTGMQLCGWRNKVSGEEKISRNETPLQELAFSGIQVINREAFSNMDLEGAFSLIDWYLQYAVTHTITAYDHSGDLLLDVGKPESIAKAELLFPPV